MPAAIQVDDVDLPADRLFQIFHQIAVRRLEAGLQAGTPSGSRQAPGMAAGAREGPAHNCGFESLLFPMRPSAPRSLPAAPDEFPVQTKFDGWNVVIGDGCIWTRRGNDITSWREEWGFDLQPPHFVNADLVVQAADPASALRADIPGIRAGRCRPLFLAFDLMLEGPPIEGRLAMLGELASVGHRPVETVDPRQTGASWNDVNALLERAKTAGHEGIQIRDRPAPAQSPRNPGAVPAIRSVGSRPRWRRR